MRRAAEGVGVALNARVDLAVFAQNVFDDMHLADGDGDSSDRQQNQAKTKVHAGDYGQTAKLHRDFFSAWNRVNQMLGQLIPQTPRVIGLTASVLNRYFQHLGHVCC